mmetsp:Transcript_74083/g.217395  ORF Transcript_74083/g.217395 Transcript_74083/m.217395 type:complete len:276 (-) Transcript_74083:1010-1837(-)
MCRVNSACSQEPASRMGKSSAMSARRCGIAAGSRPPARASSGSREKARGWRCQTRLTARSVTPPRPKRPPSTSRRMCSRWCLRSSSAASRSTASPTCASALAASRKSCSRSVASAASEVLPKPWGQRSATCRQRSTRPGTLSASSARPSSCSRTSSRRSSTAKQRGGGHCSLSECTRCSEGSASARPFVTASASQLASATRAWEGPLRRFSAQFRPWRETSSSDWPRASSTVCRSSPRISRSSSRLTCWPHLARPVSTAASSPRPWMCLCRRMRR